MLDGILLPSMVSLIEAIDWLLRAGESLCVPRSVESRLLIGLEKGVEGIVLGEVVAIVPAYRRIAWIMFIVMILMSRIHYYEFYPNEPKRRNDVA